MSVNPSTFSPSRRRLLRAGASVPLLAVLGPLLAGCEQADDERTIDTYNGLLALLVPGNDAYSLHQGVSRNAPGGVGAGAAPHVIETYHEAFPLELTATSEVDPYIESFVSETLNGVATQVKLFNRGPFKSPFANLSFADKIEVFRRLEEERPLYDQTIVRFLFNTLPTLTAFIAYSEAPVLDPVTRTLTARPVGWDLSNYPGVADGRDELIGYYRGVQNATEEV